MEQAKSLQASLKSKGVVADVHIAMRYWHPMTEEVIEQIQKDKIEEVVLLPLYPQYSKVTTGSSANAWSNAVKKMNANHFSTKLVESYYTPRQNRSRHRVSPHFSSCPATRK